MQSERPAPNAELQGFEPLRVIFAIVALVLGCVCVARAESGEMQLHASDGRHVAVANLSTQVAFTVTGLVAQARVTQRFHNNSDAWLEGQYLLPLPEGAAVHSLRMLIGKRVITGEIREKAQARSEYAQAVASGQKASLVEAHSANLFRTALANVAPGETVEIEIGYWQRVMYRDGEFSLGFPLTYTPRYSGSGAQAGFADALGATAAAPPALATPAPHVSIEVDLDPGLPLLRVESSTHSIAIDQRGQRYRISLQSTSVASDRDFELRWSPKPSAAPVAAVFSERVGAENYALVMLVPPTQDAPILPRELILIIDTSGSMQGASLVQAKAALDMALRQLDPADRFNVIQFNSSSEALFPAAVSASAADVQLARDWVNGLRATGGTEMAPALGLAFTGAAPEGYLRQIVFATDGAVENDTALYALIEQSLGSSRLFPVGIGSAPNTHFLSKAAQMGRGSEVVIHDLNEVGERMQTLFAKLDKPALRDLQLSWPGTVEAYPQRLPDLYHDEPVLVVAQVAELKGQLQAQGLLASSNWTQSLVLHGQASSGGIARLWARQKIDALEDSLIRGADAEVVRAQIIAVATAHHLVSRHTSLVAVESTPSRPADAELQSTEIANATPAGSLAFAQTATGAPLKLALGLLALLLGMALRRTSRFAAIHPDHA